MFQFKANNYAAEPFLKELGQDPNPLLWFLPAQVCGTGAHTFPGGSPSLSEQGGHLQVSAYVSISYT